MFSGRAPMRVTTEKTTPYTIHRPCHGQRWECAYRLHCTGSERVPYAELDIDVYATTLATLSKTGDAACGELFWGL